MHKPITARLTIRRHVPRDRPAKGHYSQPRPPYDEPLTPGLRKEIFTDAIGFVDFSVIESEYEDDYE
jgi:hypothetical protein